MRERNLAFVGCRLVQQLPSGNLLQEVLISLYDESKVRTLCGVTRLRKVGIVETPGIVAERHPHIVHQIEADIDAEAIIDHTGSVRVIDARVHTNIPATLKSTTPIDSDQVGISRVPVVIEFSAHVFESVLQRQLHGSTKPSVRIEVIDESRGRKFLATGYRIIVDEIRPIEE